MNALEFFFWEYNFFIKKSFNEEKHTILYTHQDCHNCFLTVICSGLELVRPLESSLCDTAKPAVNILA